MTKLYLVRHGETELNKKGCYYGWTNCELSLTGRKQAKLLQHAFENIKLDAVFSSDLKRAADTANIIIQGRDMPLHTDERLRELNFGAWEGKHFTEIMKEHKESWEAWTADWQNAAPLEGESFGEMCLRVKGCIQEILNEHIEKDILIVAHQGVLRIIVAYLLGMPMDKIWNFHFEQGTYSALELQDSLWVVKSINKI